MHKLKSKYIKLSKKTRLYSCSLPIVGLTGGIASGKTLACDFFKSMGIYVINADELVKKIYHENSTKKLIKKIIPEVLDGKRIDFKLLRQVFFTQNQIKSELEAHIYSLLPSFFLKEVQTAKSVNAKFLIYEVPLLFEKKLQHLLDISILIYTNETTQRLRIRKRDASNEDTITKIIDAQASTEFKISQSNFSIDNSCDEEALRKNLNNFLSKITE